MPSAAQLADRLTATGWTLASSAESGALLTRKRASGAPAAVMLIEWGDRRPMTRAHLDALRSYVESVGAPSIR